jgi:hypothetical protein
MWVCLSVFVCLCVVNVFLFIYLFVCLRACGGVQVNLFCLFVS